MEQKIALLVLAHSNPHVLAEFVARFSSEKFQFYVHVDAKVDVSAYRDQARLRNAIFIESRIDVFWGGFNMVRATLALGAAALRYPTNGYFCLTSDDSFPLVSPDRFYRDIESQPFRMDAWRPSVEQCERYSRFYRFDSAHSSARHIPAEKRNVGLDDILVYERMRRLIEKGKKPLQIYGGSQWWAMPREMLQSIIQEADADSWLSESFEFSAIPDEHFFQTLAMSRLRDRTSSNNSPVFVDFTRDPKPFVFSSPMDIDKTRLAGKLLIRKVAPDPALLDWLACVGES